MGGRGGEDAGSTPPAPLYEVGTTKGPPNTVSRGVGTIGGGEDAGSTPSALFYEVGTTKGPP